MTMTTEAVITAKQHRRPCHDCPWRRASLPGWLGDGTVAQWVEDAHSDARVECHTKTGPGSRTHQCAGLAIYRANVLKLPRDREVLRLEKDRKNVFASPAEFTAHHGGGD